MDDVAFKAVTVNDRAVTLLPVIKSNTFIDVENKEITEWENFQNTVAIIKGGARNSYAVEYLATDYAENRERYLAGKKLDIKITGIVFVLDIYKSNNTEGGIQYSDDFTAYIPNNDVPGLGCFDFIGELEDFKEITLTGANDLTAYIMKVRLITNPDVKDFFTINMYVTPGNMRFTQLIKGMKITGMFQMQGKIV
jgi:hypothetical protein